MIKINLLPPSERPVDRTPLPRFLLILTTVAAAAGAVAFIAFLIFVQVKAVNSDLKEKKDELARYKQQVAQYDQMSKELGDLDNKIKEIDSIAGREFVWWQILDAIWSVVVRHRVWLDEIKVLDEKAVQAIMKKSDPSAKALPPYGVLLKCKAASQDPLVYATQPTMADVMTAFRLDLKKHPLLAKLLPQVNFNVDFKVLAEKDYYEGFAMSFEVVLMAEVQAPPTRTAPGARK